MRPLVLFCHLIKQSRQDFLSDTNSQTPVAKEWKKIDKIRSKYSTSSLHILNSPNGQVTDTTTYFVSDCPVTDLDMMSMSKSGKQLAIAPIKNPA